MDNKYYIKKREELCKMLDDNSRLVLFSGVAPRRSADQTYKYTVNRNFYYLTGLDRENFILLISKRNDKVIQTLFIEEVDPMMEKWVGRKLRKEEAIEISGIENIQYIKDFNGFFNNTLIRTGYENLYLDLEKRGWDESPTPALSYAKDIREKYPYLNIKNVYNTISDMRLIKTEEELEMIKKAISITNEGIKSLMKNANAGMMEYQLEAYFDFTIKTLGAKGHAFRTIAASGENATVLHYEENNSTINENDLILFDLGADYGYYCADISRTFPVSGKFTERQKEIYNIVLKAQEETIKGIKAGVQFSELNNITKSVLTEECKKIGLIKEDTEISKYYYHGVSHYLGLDTHDVGTPDKYLQPGMVLTVEPGLYIEEEKIGIRIEDNVVVTEDGCENLSKDIIKTVEDIEEFMKNR